MAERFVRSHGRPEDGPAVAPHLKRAIAPGNWGVQSGIRLGAVWVHLVRKLAAVAMRFDRNWGAGLSPFFQWDSGARRWVLDMARQFGRLHGGLEDRKTAAPSFDKGECPDGLIASPGYFAHFC